MLINSLYVCLILIFIYFAKVKGNSGDRSCSWSTPTVAEVESCPAKKEEFIRRKRLKNCEVLGRFQNCTEPSKFTYHCLMTEHQNKFVEVCAPEYYIIGKELG